MNGTVLGLFRMRCLSSHRMDKVLASNMDVLVLFFRAECVPLRH